MTVLTPARSSSRSSNRLSHLRRARWFNGVLLAAVVCAVGVFTVGMSCHDHDTAAVPCAICQVTAHSALQVYAPQFAPVAPAIRVEYLAYAVTQRRIPAHAFVIKNQPRAPPFA
ncbi:MAG: hypothetical protein ACRETQ_02400 [Gammaproteobacteria bacterium]